MDQHELSNEERVIVSNLIDMIGSLPGGRAMIAERARGARLVAKGLRDGGDYGAAGYEGEGPDPEPGEARIADQIDGEGPTRNRQAAGDAELAGRVKGLERVLSLQAGAVAKIIQGLGMVDDLADELAFASEDLGPSPGERLAAQHRVQREAEELAQKVAESLRAKRGRHRPQTAVEKAETVEQVAAELSEALARLQGGAAREGASETEKTREVAKDLLTATFTAEAASPNRRW